MRFKKYIFILFLLILSLFLITPSYAEDLEFPNLYSESAILVHPTTGKILYEKNAYEKMYPASLTKIMSAIIVLEKCQLSDIATVSYNAVMTLDSGYVTANLQIGEELTVEQLLYVMMIGSSNDASIVLAEHISGTEEAFSALMNEKAKELGCKNTNFVNSNGVHDENHYSTAYDLALISSYAMKNVTFKKIVSTTSYQLPATNKYENTDRLFTNTNSLLIVNNNNRSDNYYYKYATGIKTGFTTPAGNCLATSSTKDGMDLICIVLKSLTTDDGLSARNIDTIALLNFGYTNYSLRKVTNACDIIQTVKVKNATRETKQLNAIVEEEISLLIESKNISTSLLPTVSLYDNLKAPIKKGEIIGKVTYNVCGITYESNLIAQNDVKSSRLFLKFVIFVFLILIGLTLLRLRAIKLKNKKKRIKYMKKI